MESLASEVAENLPKLPAAAEAAAASGGLDAAGEAQRVGASRADPDAATFSDLQQHQQRCNYLIEFPSYSFWETIGRKPSTTGPENRETRGYLEDFRGVKHSFLKISLGFSAFFKRQPCQHRLL